MTRSKATLLRRSGVALYNVADLIDWSPTSIFQVGVGHMSQEVMVFQEAWPEAKLVGFEPHPDLFQLIQDYPGYPGKLINKALGRYKQNVMLCWKSAHQDGAFVCFGSDLNEGGDLKRADVEMDTLDNYHSENIWRLPGERTLLWLDCEGSELDVLIGGESFVECVDVVNIELTGKPPYSGWPEPVIVNRWLLDHGFLLQYIHTQRTSSGQVDAIYVRPELFKPEYCCCPLMVEEWRKSKGIA